MLRLSIRFFLRYTTAAAFAALAIVACQPKATDDPNPTETASFALMQDRIFATSCAVTGCHASSADNTFNQHKLVLEKSVAYSYLVGVAPTQPTAKAEGLLRVKAFSADKSLLFHKLNFGAQHHGGKTYGSPMPLGGKPLSVGQIEFVRRWIEAGAPEKGNVADEKLLDDTTPSYVETFEPLAAPAPGEGFQLKVDKFEVAPNFERELFVRRMVGNAQDIYVNRILLRARTNSHHLVLYDFKDKRLLPTVNEIRDLRNPNGSLNVATYLTMQNHLFLGGGSETNTEYVFPEGMAIMLPANSSLDVNPHYYNRTSQVLYGENYANLYTVPKEKVQRIVQMLDLNNTNLNLPPGQRTTVTKDFTFSKAAKIIMLTSHNHELAEKFVIKIKGGPRNGEVVYENTDWAHPLKKNYPTPISLSKGEGLTSVVTYNNTTARTVTFGLQSTDEMNIIFGYYYEE
ncbi:MAG: hypothetical protein LH606_10970 [Cytophagaceae bacterium]|nr:hypothetical protein [Cytophagaceae bacterium]